MKSCVIFGAAPIEEPFQWVLPLIPENSLILCADGGFRFAQKLGVSADFLIGDMDSLGNHLPERTKTIIVPAEKDETDLFLCINKALDLGCGDIHIFGALGGRMDHTFGNLALLYYGLEQNAKVCLYAKNNRLQMTRQDIRLYRDGYRYFSVFAFGGEAVYTVKNAKYPCSQLHLTPGSIIGSSNEMLGEYTDIIVHSGTLLLISSSD